MSTGGHLQALALVQQQHLPPPLPASFADDPLLLSGDFVNTPPSAAQGMSPYFMSDPGLATVPAQPRGQQPPQQRGQLNHGGWEPVPSPELLHGPPTLQQAAGFADVPEEYFAHLQRRMAHPGAAAPGQQKFPGAQSAPRLSARGSRQQLLPPPLLQQQLQPTHWPAGHGLPDYPAAVSQHDGSPYAELLLPGMQTTLPLSNPLASLDRRLSR